MGVRISRRKNMICYLLVACVTFHVLLYYILDWLSDKSFDIRLRNRFNDYPLHQQSNVLFRNGTLQILIFNTYNGPSIKEMNNVLEDVCEWSNCRLTSKRSNLQSHSAIIFNLTTEEALPHKPPISPSNRNPHQVWIFAWVESPVHHGGTRNIYQNEHWRNTVNWTMTYTYDADIFYPYGVLRKRTPPVKNYRQIFQRKTKMAAWVVSNCHPPSQREIYVKKLQQYGVEVDVFGECVLKNIDNDILRKEIDLNYKFYLSFENSLCKDYITEKFFKYFQYDVVLVVRGGGNYSSLLPNDSYINTAEFGSIQELSHHLLSVGSSEKKYTKFLKNKDRFESADRRALSFCDICQKLNNLEKNRRIYTDLVERIHRGTCSSPSDLNSNLLERLLRWVHIY